MRRQAAALLLVAAVVMLAPSAAAAVRVVATPPSAPMKPDQFGTLAIDVEVDCSTVARHMEPATQSVPVRVSVEVGGTVIATEPDAIALSGQGCAMDPTGAVRGNTTATLVVSREAVALTDLPGTVLAEITTAPPPLLPPEPFTGNATFAVQAEPYFLLVAQAAQSRVPVDGPSASAIIEVRNGGNARTQVALEMPNPPGNGTVSLGGPVLLDSAKVPGGAPSQTFHVTFQPPATGWTEEAVRLHLQPTAAGRPEFSGDPLTVDLVFYDAKPAGKDAPGVPPLLLAGALVLLAVRRRRLDGP